MCAFVLPLVAQIFSSNWVDKGFSPKRTHLD